MSTYRDESDFDWDYSTEPAPGDKYVVPYNNEEREQQRMRHPTSGVLLAQMRETLIQANGIIKQTTDNASQITQADNVQQILAGLTEQDREVAMRLASAVGNNAFEYFFSALHQLDQLVQRLYQREQQLELTLYRPGGLGESLEMKECSANAGKTEK